MFYWCKALETINLQTWDTHNVTSMSGMFSKADALTSLENGQWDTSKMSGYLFSSMDNLDTLILGSKSLIKNFGLPEKKDVPYTERWVSDDTDTVYKSTADFISNYDGSNPGAYTRE